MSEHIHEFKEGGRLNGQLLSLCACGKYLLGLKESGSECRCATQMVCRLHATEAQRNCEHEHYDRTQGIHSSWCQKCGLGLPKLKEATMQQEWCEHIIWEKEDAIHFGGWRNKHLPKAGNNMGAVLGEMVHKDIMFCGICGAVRPPAEPPKALRLWEIIQAAIYKETDTIAGYKSAGDEALDAVLEIVRDVIPENEGASLNATILADVCKRLQALRGEE